MGGSLLQPCLPQDLSRKGKVFTLLLYLHRQLISRQWQEYDPWDLTGRLDANMNMYEGPGGCSVFRTFQSWLGLSRHGPQQGKLVIDLRLAQR
jgi:Protein of unknown function (DUF1479).